MDWPCPGIVGRSIASTPHVNNRTIGSELPAGGLDLEHKVNYVPFSFLLRERDMVRAVVEEAAALASLTLFLGMIDIWAQVIAAF